MRSVGRLFAAGSLCVSAFLLAACSDDDGAATPTTSSTSQPTNDSTPTSAPGAQPPALRTTGEDLNAVVRSIFEYRTWIARHPNPEAFRAIYAEECACLANDQAKYSDYVAKGLRWDDEGIVVLDVTEIRRVNPNFARVRVVTQHGPQRLVDGAGKVVREGPGWKPFADVYELVRTGPEAPWKVSLIDSVGYLEGQGRS